MYPMPAVRRTVTLLALMSASGFLFAQSKPADEIHWTITGDTSVTFDWRGAADEIQYGLTLPYNESHKAHLPRPEPISSAGPFHEVTLSGLEPDKLYHYSIGKGADRTFRTPPLRGSSGFTVAAEGDVGSSVHYNGVVPVQSMIASRLPSFVLVLGDLTYGHPEGQRVVDQHFNDVMAWSQDAAYMPAWGNHEWEVPQDDDLRNYKGRFKLPHSQTSAGAPLAGCCGKDWYWFDYGNTRFIAYPEPYDASTYAQWYEAARKLMDKAEDDPKLAFIVTFGHRAPFTSGYHDSDLPLREEIAKLGHTHPKYVLNLNGHSHDYERSQVIEGVVSVTIGTGGAPLEQNKTPCLFRECPKPSWSVIRQMHWGILQLHFNSGAIEGEFLCGPAGGGKNDITCAPGTVVDRFTLPARSKGAHQALLSMPHGIN